ncbi:MAG: DUF2218 domain-containing protein [Alphaproteobacteria bacterium]
MARAETEIQTTRASLYLQLLCKHWSHKFEVAFTPEQGKIPFRPDVTCFLDAKDDVLKLAIETPTPDDLARMEGVVINHLKRFAHREDIGEPVWRAA